MPLMTLHGGMGGVDQSLLFGPRPRRHRHTSSRGRPLPTGLISARRSAPVRPAPAQADLYAALLDSLGIERTIVCSRVGRRTLVDRVCRPPSGSLRRTNPSSTATGAFAVPDHAIRRLMQFQRLARLPGLATLLGWLGGRHPETAAARSILDTTLFDRTLRIRKRERSSSTCNAASSTVSPASARNHRRHARLRRSALLPLASVVAPTSGDPWHRRPGGPLLTCRAGGTRDQGRRAFRRAGWRTCRPVHPPR